MKVLFYLVNLSLMAFVLSASIIDTIISPNSRQSYNEKNCVCKESSCICCMDFNVSFIDLGGPACVRLNYFSPENGIDLNISYGDSFTHHDNLKGLHAKPICLNLLSTYAQMCARFNELTPIGEEIRGCLQFEPTLLGEPQLEILMGCFDMRANEMKLVHPSPATVIGDPEISHLNSKKSKTNETTEATDIAADTSVNAEEILAVVNESANKGIAFLSDWLGLTVKTENSTAKKNDSY